MLVCSRKGCSEAATVAVGELHYCVPCYRIHLMRRAAKAARKVVPTFGEVLAMVPADMKCPCCQTAMHWHGKAPRTFQVTLQHWRDGSLGLICYRCNTRERNYPDDASIFNVPHDHKLCPKCRQTKSFEDFGTTTGGYALSYCRPCANEQAKKYLAENREAVLARKRARYAASKLK
jgi:hypothetical protein